MKHLWGALLVLALSAFMPDHLSAQGVSTQTGKAQGAGLELGQNYPNPFNPEAFFPFDVRVDECTDGSRQHVVTLKIYNVLMQPIATPTLRASSTSPTPCRRSPPASTSSWRSRWASPWRSARSSSAWSRRRA